VGTDLARRALARPDALTLTLTLAPRVARSLARFRNAQSFNQPLSSWDTSSVTTMSYMWVLTSPAVRSPAPTRSRSRPRSLRASLARFYYAKNFNQDLSGWVVNNVNGRDACQNFCFSAGFNPPATIPSFPGTCGDPGC
jgi:surface protein